MIERKPSISYWLTAAIIGLLIATCMSLFCAIEGRWQIPRAGLLRMMEFCDFDTTIAFGDSRFGLAQIA